MSEALDYFQEIGIETVDHGDDVSFKVCPFDGRKDCKLRYNIPEDKFFCHHNHSCGKNGNSLNSFKIFRGEYTPRKVSYHEKKRRSYVVPEMNINHKPDDQWYEKYQVDRGISVQIAKHYKVGRYISSDGDVYVYHYFDRSGNLINRKYRASWEKRSWQDADTDNVYYGMQFVNPALGYLIVVEGEDDVHACKEIGLFNVVGLPLGAENYTPAMEEFHKFMGDCPIYLGFDMDEAGERGARKFAHKAGMHRVWRFQWPGGAKDARDALLAGTTREQVNDAISHAIQYESDTIMRAGRMTEEVLSKTYHRGSLGTPIEIREFNRHIGGLRPYELSYLTGHTGSGKSTFLKNLMIWGAKAGMGSMIMSFENQPWKEVRMMAEILSGKQINAYNENTCQWETAMDESELEHWIREVDKLNINFFFPPKGTGGYYKISDMISDIDYAYKFFGTTLFGIDHLHYFVKSAGDRSQEEINETIRKLVDYRYYNPVHIVLLGHPAKPQGTNGRESKMGVYSGKGSSVIAQEPDNVWIVGQVEEGGQWVERHKDRETYGNRYARFELGVLANGRTYVNRGDENTRVGGIAGAGL